MQVSVYKLPYEFKLASNEKETKCFPAGGREGPGSGGLPALNINIVEAL